MSDRVLVAGSLLSADFAHLCDQVTALEQGGAEWVHFDTMDGHFVPPLTFGPLVLQALRPCTSLVCNAHLMISNPQDQVAHFAAAGADGIIFHREVMPDPLPLLQRIRDLGCEAGLAYSPETPVEDVDGFVPHLDMVLIMSVRPGWGGQEFMTDSLPRITRVREAFEAQDSPAFLGVDGGVDEDTAPLILAAGADVLISGSFIFHHPRGIAAALAQLRG
jgi:ribulose-phosphate 3-epimerase